MSKMLNPVTALLKKIIFLDEPKIPISLLKQQSAIFFCIGQRPCCHHCHYYGGMCHCTKAASEAITKMLVGEVMRVFSFSLMGRVNILLFRTMSWMILGWQVTSSPMTVGRQSLP